MAVSVISADHRTEQAGTEQAGTALRVLERGEVRRSRLVERLAGAARPLVVVVAPAGYGKTTLLRQWAADDPRPFAWLTARAEHDDPAVLLGAVICALEEVDPIGEPLGATRSGPDAASLLWSLHIGAALSARTVPSVLVVDDVHRLTSTSALAVLEAVFQHLPPGTQLVLAGRSEPPFALPGSAMGDATRLGAIDLALDASESELLLSNAGVHLDSSGVETVMARTECWPAGLSLAAASLAGSGNLDAFDATGWGVTEYLTREVLDDLDDATIEFLTRTSVLEDLTGSLCDAVTERSYSARVLKRLEQSNLFLVPVDTRRTRYRYHRLFRDFLQNELRCREPDAEPAIHRRASAWYEQHGRREQAIRHAVAAGDTDGAARLVWEDAGTTLARGRPATLRDRLQDFTEEQVAADPRLALAAAAADLAEGRADDAANWLWLTEHTRERAGEPDTGALRPYVALLHMLLREHGLARTEEDTAPFTEIEDDRSPWRALSGFYAGLVRHLAGDVYGARALFDDTVQRSAVLCPAVHAACLAELALLDALAGAWDDAATTAARGHDYVEERSLTDYAPIAIVPAVDALVAAHAGDAAHARAAADHALRLVHALGRVAPPLRAEVRTVLARTSLLLGDTAGAREHLRDLRPLLAGMPEAVGLHARVAQIDDDLRAIADAIVGPLALTAAELRVLAYLPMHLSLSEIAQRLFVSRNTVKSQAIAIYRKLAVSSRGAAVTRAHELGLLDD